MSTTHPFICLYTLLLSEACFPVLLAGDHRSLFQRHDLQGEANTRDIFVTLRFVTGMQAVP